MYFVKLLHDRQVSGLLILFARNSLINSNHYFIARYIIDLETKHDLDIDNTMHVTSFLFHT